MNKKRHYLVYKTTCLINGKIYIGQHQTTNLDDGYLGSGRDLLLAIEEFGNENFKREILFDFDNFEDMNRKEKELVTEEFVSREDTYNVRLGGQNDDWFNFMNEKGLADNSRAVHLGGVATAKLMKEDMCFRQKMIEKISESCKKHWREHPENLIHSTPWFLGKLWVYNEKLRQNKFVSKEESKKLLDKGRKKGRKMSFYK